MKPVEIDDGSIGNAGNPVSGGNQGAENPSIVGKNLRDANNISIRPVNLSSAHLYNLRNQSWGVPRLQWDGSDTLLSDPVGYFHSVANKFPSNADNLNLALYANTGSDNDKVLERFNVRDLVNNPPGISSAPMGHYIIDLMNRGTSRIAATKQEKVQYPTLDFVVGTIPSDITPGGPSLACEYAGRVFYAGFSGEIVDGDANSPRLSSYVAFSQLVTDQSSVTNCFQQADPTNKDENDLVDTDGGFIRFEGAYHIVGLINIGSNLAVIANNGVWLLTGGNNSGFKATDYQTNKITNSGCVSPGSVIVVDNTFLYWGQDGIYHVAPNQFGDYTATNITEKTIQKYYAAISTSDAIKCEGVYDSYEKKVKWVYGNTLLSGTVNKELVLDLSLGAFYPSVITPLGTTIYPKLIKGVQTEPFITGNSTDAVVLPFDNVVVSGDQVVIDVASTGNVTKEVRYLLVKDTSLAGRIVYTFGSYYNNSHRDWVNVNGVGNDAYAYLLTGTFVGNDSSRKKTIPYVTVHLKKTETNLVDDGFGDYTPNDKSSCTMQAQWNWSNSPNSGQWSRPSQVYRFKRHFFPVSTDGFDNGYYVVETRNKLRGSGHSVSLLFTTEPGYHCELLGWSLPVETSTDV